MVGSLSGGRFVIAWADAHPIGRHLRRSAKAKIFGSDGSFVRDLFQRPPLSDKDHYPAAIAGLSGGGFVVAREEPTVFTAEHGPTKAAVFSAEGERVSKHFEVCGEALHAPHSISLASCPEGGFVAAWTAWGASGRSPVTVRAQVYGPYGEPNGSPIMLGNGQGQRNPAVLALDDAQFLVAWEEIQANDNVCVKARFV